MHVSLPESYDKARPQKIKINRILLFKAWNMKLLQEITFLKEHDSTQFLRFSINVTWYQVLF